MMPSMKTASTHLLPKFDRPLEFQEAFRRTMDEFRISNQELADLTGIASTKISSYKTGKQLWSGNNFERIMRALTPEQRKFFLSIAFNDDMTAS